MAAEYQDAMAICRKTAPADLFITMTCNPKWDEIQQSLSPGQVASDRPDIVSRVFKQKLDQLLVELFQKNIFGEVAP